MTDNVNVLIVRFISGDNLVLGSKFHFKDGDNEVLAEVYDWIENQRTSKFDFKFQGSKYVLMREFIVMAEMRKDI